VLKRWKSPVPVVYNSSGYESVETLKALDGLVDIYLPDFKYIRPEKAEKYSGAADYPAVVLPALREMQRQVGEAVFDADGMMQRGMIIRHLILPSNTNSSLEILDCIQENFPAPYVSLMAQYTPCGNLERFPEMARPLTKREYEKVANYALSRGFSRLFLQELTAADKKFIPAFDFTGIM